MLIFERNLIKHIEMIFLAYDGGFGCIDKLPNKLQNYLFLPCKKKQSSYLQRTANKQQKPQHQI
ncbi:unnamed protein product [Paramecium sonneborni]|uniref:Uncharacterized protein n=1 Tax=Paramecium sonneborni TaxID=65129 RepID=A0A8S1KWU1_9CILI|nr:unnamed protein product [Paramecium sonneborni]